MEFDEEDLSRINIYQEVIKERDQLIDKGKYKSFKEMDALIQKLGYMDYRDLLAANRYVFEAQRYGDDLQQARAQTLAYALSQMTRLKREAFERRVTKKFRELKSQHEGDSELNRDQVKLDLLRDEDPFYSKVYQEIYAELRDSNTDHRSGLEKLHDRFDDYYNRFKNNGMAKTRLYELEEVKWEDDVEMTTDFSDENDLIFYRRYKMWSQVNKDKAKEFNEEQALLTSRLIRGHGSDDEEDFQAGVNSDGESIVHDVYTQLANLRERKAEFNKKDANIELEMARIRHRKEMKRRDYMLWKEDHAFGNYHPQH